MRLLGRCEAKEAQVDPQVITKGEEVLKAEAGALQLFMTRVMMFYLLSGSDFVCVKAPKHEARQLLAAQLAKAH